MARRKALPTQQDISRMHEDDLGRENALLGERADRNEPAVRQSRIALGKELMRRQDERVAEVRRKEARGEVPPGHYVYQNPADDPRNAG